jgi:MarR family 2-MHQ and catechol resistance regulon transcriptional repressor
MPVHFKGTPDEESALDAHMKLLRSSDSISHSLAHDLLVDGLTLGQLGVLEALLHLGPLTQRDLGQKLLRSGANVTTVIDNLERDQLVVRERGKEDRRLVTVRLTPAGRRLIEKIFPRHVARIVTAFSALSQREQAELSRLCRKLGRAVQERADRRDE